MMTSTTTNNTNAGGGAGVGVINDSNASSDSNSNGNSNINSIEAEYNSIPDRNGWHRFYLELREKCDREANEKHFITSESEKPQNRFLNRYRDVNPYDHSRIVIHRGSVDYINANLVKFDRAERKYILTQGPLGDTVGHFWLMVWEQNTKAILMLNKLMEKKQVKCHLYWPERKGAEHALKLNEVKLTIELLRCEEYKDYCRRWFKLTDVESNQSREIIQFHYTTWPDFGIPSSPVAFLRFLKQVRDSGALEPDVGPAVVHCSAGIGRSGTFCLVDCCLVLIDRGEDDVSVKDVLSELRTYRMGLIQTMDQLYFSYQAIIEGMKLLKDPSFIDYKEEPIIRNDDQRCEPFNLDETPPPLPPPRSLSLLPLAGTAGGMLTLNLCGTQTKPLPKIPTSESFNDDLYAPDNNQHKNKDALNNFINNEKTIDNMSNRPLPPLPPSQKNQNSLDCINDSDSDENDLYEDDSDDEAADDENANNESNGSNTKFDDLQNNTTEDLNDVRKLNGIEGLTNRTTSPDNELKRRKRVERQANIEQRVNEIKRKQREAEENQQAAKKRRRVRGKNENDTE
ncbi:tyrosine-protein phosphatase non-receptor type 61F isoform X2 [Teleopsis dalmanni]|uniref:tyrosine-protein phosphatase non-receptor type 61F isoform X2 n=1 Tax=Teleopsis dalmanni TaxID=139649 RepID=UPI0018CEF160|nr:tyrosine-protein phosphatase non-receptor type 61F isoform X2 [Teleopsis dalmanni]